MTCRIIGLGTATPIHQMSQADSLQMFTDIACEDPKQARYARALFRKAAVEKRHTSVPHTAAYNWCPTSTPNMASEAELGQDPAYQSASQPVVLAGQSQGPTTRERMEMYGQFAGDLAVESASEALAVAGVTGDQITHLVVVTCTGFDAPGVDIELIRRLNLPATTQRIQVGFMGCHGAINGLRVARAITGADPNAKVLLCAVELCSLHYRFTWDPACIIGNALFADGSAALILAGQNNSPPSVPASDDQPSCASGSVAASELDGWRVEDTGSVVIADSGDSMSWRVGDHGFEMRLANDVGEKIEQHLAVWFKTWLKEKDLQMADIDYWGIHPGGPRILSAVQSGLELDAKQLTTSRTVLRQYGNMSSPTVLFILQQFLSQQTHAEKSDARHAILLGFGPGLVAEVALFQSTDTTDSAFPAHYACCSQVTIQGT